MMIVGFLAMMLAACGGGGAHHDGASTSVAPSAAERINVVMRDIAFVPDKLDVKQGSTVTFVFTNEGKVVHDAFIGDETAQADHEAEMSGGEDHHMENANAITVEPGKTGELTHTFSDAATLIIGCHEPGHYAAGMKVAVAIT